MKDFYKVVGVFHATWKDPSRDQETEYGKKKAVAGAECVLFSLASRSNGKRGEYMYVQPGRVATLVLRRIGFAFFLCVMSSVHC